MTQAYIEGSTMTQAYIEGSTMTQAYIEGFCKAAEAHGVDPQELYKYAQSPARIMKTIRLASKIPLGDLENQASALTSAISKKNSANAMHGLLGLKPEFRTRPVGARTQRLRDILSEIAGARYEIGGYTKYNEIPEALINRNSDEVLYRIRKALTGRLYMGPKNKQWFKDLIGTYTRT